MTTFGRLSSRQERALLALLTEPTQQAAATAAGVGERTLRRWLKDEVFTDALAEARKAQATEALSVLQSSLLEAVTRLRELLHSQSEHIACKAATTLLTFGVQAQESDELRSRLEALEKELRRALERQGYPARTLNGAFAEA